MTKKVNYYSQLMKH